MTRRELINLSDSKLNSTVKVAGTNYDRRRVVTGDMKRKMIQMYDAGKSIHTIAEHFGVVPDTVKRAVNSSYNESEKARKREVAREHGYRSNYSSAYYSKLAEYKRSLLERRRPLIISE